MPISEFVSILDYIESNNIPTQKISEYYEENLNTLSVVPLTSIVSIEQSTATEGSNEIIFTESETDEDVTGSSTEASFSNSTSDIAVGNHTIGLSVQDDDGTWSEEATESLENEPPVQMQNGTNVT
jgi:hypothetical protein